MQFGILVKIVLVSGKTRTETANEISSSFDMYYNTVVFQNFAVVVIKKYQ